MPQSNFGLIGLGVMGQNLARNVASNGFRTSVYNRTTNVTNDFVAAHGSEMLVGQKTIKAFVQSLEGPRKIFIMVKAGPAVDAVIASLLPHLDKGDIIIDGGNSYYRDTQRREADVKKQGIHFVGCGVSGGEEGALRGPSLMPGGSAKAWRNVKNILEAVAAKDFDGGPCVTHLGTDGAGHYVKMVHNGIEYAIMQMIAETYSLYKDVYKLPAPNIAERFEKMNRSKLGSFLFEITIPVLRKKGDRKSKGYLIDAILDKAGSKGTGKWTAQDALDRGIAVPSIAQAVFARSLSARKEDRVALAKKYPLTHPKPMPLAAFNNMLSDALYAAIISCYAQGFDLIAHAAKEEKWEVNLAEVARIWEGGCIIRAKMLKIFHVSFSKAKGDAHIFAAPHIQTLVKKHVPKLRSFVAACVSTGLPLPSFASSLFYIESMTIGRSSAAMIQGLRDYFGAHTYERTDKKGSFHSQWE